MMNAFLISCRHPPRPNASALTWQHYYDSLFRITKALCCDRGLSVQMERTHADGTTAALRRPHFVLLYQYLVLMRGEEKSGLEDINQALGELVQKMSKWDVVLYGTLPYILGYATAGDELQLVAIERSGGACRYTKLVGFNVLLDKATALKVFYNLAFVLFEMAMLTNHSYACVLKPFVPDINDKRRIELLDGVVQRTVKNHHSSEFERIVTVYKALQELSTEDSSVTHLQTVENLTVTSDSLVVDLSPLGWRRYPSIAEAGECLRHVLTALKHWHGRGFYHGDVQWRNIVLVPADTGNSAFWVLIDMDESSLPDTTIDWNHQFEGEKLRFQHGLYQAGDLLNQCFYPLPDKLKEVQAMLRSAVDCAEFTAEIALAKLTELLTGSSEH